MNIWDVFGDDDEDDDYSSTTYVGNTPSSYAN